MSKTDSKLCRICLTTNEDDNIADSWRFKELFIQLISSKDLRALWLCLWCRTTLKKAAAFRKMALQSEEILNSENEVLADISQRNKCHNLSYEVIKHIDIPPYLTENAEKQPVILITDNNIAGHKISTKINHLNEVFIANEIINEDINETRSNNEINYLKNEIMFYENEIDMKLENNIEHESNMNNKIKCKNEIKNGSIKFDNEMCSNENRRDLKLVEMKFEMRYLNIEEQLKELEAKKLKYRNMKYQCDLCGVGFQSSEYFEEHNIKHTEVAGQYKCTICHLHFKKQLVYSQHALSHRRMFLCIVCGTKITKWSNCSVHRQKCGGIVVHAECEVCSKVFSDEHTLKVHRRLHTLKKRYTCEHCGRQFNTKQKLNVHVRSHTGIKPFSCSQCDRSFTTHSNLKAHQSVHSVTTSHYCVECDTHYKTAKSLKRHLTECARHVRDRSHMFTCKQCPKEFSTDKALKNHMTRHSVTQQVQCPHCEKTFSNKSNLNKHIKCIHRNIR